MLAVIGCGHWGKNLLRIFQELGCLRAICDENTEAIAALDTKVPVLPKEAILADEGIQAVVISTPAQTHYALSKEALLAGKDVFVEKPMSLDLREAQELIRIAKEKNRILMVGHLMQYHPAFLCLKEQIAAGALGKIQYIYSNRLNFGKLRNCENILWSFAPHDISMLLSLVPSPPVSIFAKGSAYVHRHLHDVTTTHLTFQNGVEAHLFVSWLHPFKEQKLVVVGDGGMAVFDDGLEWNEKLKIYPHQIAWKNHLPEAQKKAAQSFAIAPQEPLKIECEHFLHCVHTRTEPKTCGQEGLSVLTILTAAEESLETGRAVTMGDMAKSNEDNTAFIHPTAVVDAGSHIAKGVKIWHFSHVMTQSTIGENSIIGQNVCIAPNVRVGKHCKIQNNVSLYTGVILADKVFCGPSCVFTNVRVPRAHVERKDAFCETMVGEGATIGANATIICGNAIGAYAMVGAGAVVTRSVLPHALVVGNPARQIGWVSHAGEVLADDLTCPREGRKYKVDAGQLVAI